MEPAKSSSEPSRHTSSSFRPEEMKTSKKKNKYPTYTLSIQSESPPQIAQSKNISTPTIEPEPTAPTVTFIAHSRSAIGAEGWKALDELRGLSGNLSEASTVTAQNPLTDSASTPTQPSACGVSEILVLAVYFEQLPSTSIGAQFVKEIEKSLAASSSRQQPASLKKVEESYKCCLCNKLFKSERSQFSHIKTSHFRIRKYECQFCHQSFAKSDTLKNHVRVIHTGEKPYNCHFCDERFPTRYYLARHKKEKHKAASAKKTKTKTKTKTK